MDITVCRHCAVSHLFSWHVMEDIRSWWEVPSIAHFCSLFRTAFGLTDFEIEDLEEALLSDGTVDGSSILNSTFLGDLHARLLRGLFETNDIHADNFEPFLSQVLKIRWEDELNKENPLKDSSYSTLNIQQKVEILHNLCDFRLDVADVQDLLKGLDADSLRVEPLGRDSQGNIYWYFYGTRLYKETPAVTPEEKEKRKLKKKKLATKKKKRRKKKVKGKRKQKKKASSDSESDFVTSSSSDNYYSEEEEEDLESESEEENDSSKPKWSLVCATATEWEELSESFKKSKHRDEKLLYQTLSEDFVPEIEKMIEAKDRAYQKKLLELAPRRASTRIAIKMSLKEDNEMQDYEDGEEKVNERERLAEEKRLEEEEKQKEKERLAERRQQERAERARLREERLWMRMNGEVSGESAMPENGDEEKREEPTTKKTDRMPEFDGDDDRDEDLYTGMYKVLDYLKKHNNAWPFLEPVDESYAPQYHEIIENPMDLSTIEEKLDKGEYKKLEQFQDDMQLMFDNCDEYNGPDSMYTKMANTLKAAFERQIKKHFPDDEDNSDEDYEEELRKGRRKEREREMKGKQKPFSMDEFMRSRQEPQPGSQGMGGAGMPFPFMGEMGMNRVPNPMMAASRHPQDFQFPGVPPGFGPDGRPVYPPQFYQNYYNATMARFNMPQQRQFNPYQYQPPPLTRAPMGDPQRMQFPQQGMDGRMPYQRPSPNGMTPPGLSRMQGPPRLGLPAGVTQGTGGMPARPQMPANQTGSPMMPETSQPQSSASSQSSPTSTQSVVTTQAQQQMPDQFRPSGIGSHPGGFPMQMPPNHTGQVPGQFPGYPNMNGPPRLQRAPMDQMAQNRMGPYGGQNMVPGYGMGPRGQLPPGFMPSSQGPPKSQGAPTVSVPSSTGASGSALTSPAASDASGDEKKAAEKDTTAASPVPRSTPISTSGEPTPSSLTAEKENRESEQAVAMSRPQSFGQPFPQQPYYGRPMTSYLHGLQQAMGSMPQERPPNVIVGPGGPIGPSASVSSDPSKSAEQSQSDPAGQKDTSAPAPQPKPDGPSNQAVSRPQGTSTPPNITPREQMEPSKNKGVGMSISHILGSPSRDTSSPRATENRAPVITTSRRSPPPLVSDLRRTSDKTKSDSNRSSPLIEGPAQTPTERPPSGYKSWPQDQGPPRQGSPSLSGGRPRGFLEELFNGKPPVSKDMNPGDPSSAQGPQRLPFTSLLKEIAPQRSSPGKESPGAGIETSSSDPQALGRGLGGMNQAHKDFMTRNYLRGQPDPQRYGLPKQMGPYGMYAGKMGPEGMSPLAYRAQGQDMTSVDRERAMQLAGKRTPDGQFVDLDAMQYREQPGYPTPEQLFLMEQRRQQERMASSRGSVIGGNSMHMMRYPGNMMLRQQQEQQYLQAMYGNRMRNGEYSSAVSEDAPSSKIPRFS